MTMPVFFYTTHIHPNYAFVFIRFWNFKVTLHLLYVHYFVGHPNVTGIPKRLVVADANVGKRWRLVSYLLLPSALKNSDAHISPFILNRLGYPWYSTFAR